MLFKSLFAYRSWFRVDAIWVISLFLAGSLLIGFGLLAEEVLEGDTSAFDQAILLAFRGSADPASPIGPAWLQEMARATSLRLAALHFSDFSHSSWFSTS
jgi:hypothetical protein